MEPNYGNRITSLRGTHVLMYFLLPLLIAIGLVTSSQYLIMHVLSSDLLYIVSLYKDLFVDRYSIFGWYVTPAPYFFPDMVMFFPLLWSMPDIGYAFVSYYVLFFLLCLVVLTKIASFLNKNIFNCFLCVFSAGLLFVAFVQDVAYVPISEFLLPSAHAGVILIGFALIAISLSAMHKGYSYSSATLFFLLSFLTILSDILIIPQFLLPLAITIFIFYRLCFIQLRTFQVTAGLTLGAYLAAIALIKLIKFTGIFNIPTQTYTHDMGIRTSFNTLKHFIHDIGYYIINTSNLFAVLAIFLVTSIILLFKQRKYLFSSQRSREGKSTYFIPFLIIFSFLSLTITLAALIVTGNWADLGNIRYIQTLYILPLFFLALILAVFNNRIASWLKLVVFSTVVIFSLRQIIPEATTLDAANLRLPYPELTQCLDKLAANYNLQYGYSDYWNAKETTIMSRSKVRVNQLQPNLDIYDWINNPAWYVNKVGGSEQYPKYQFILTNGLSKAEIEARFGKPAVQKACPGTEVYVYNRKSDVAFRNFLRLPATITAQQGIPLSILSPKNLRQYVFNGTNWNAPANVIIPKNGEVSFQVDPPAVSEILEISADSNDTYGVDFFMDKTLLGHLPVSTVPKPGMQARYLSLPESMLGKPFNRLVIRPQEGDGSYSVGDIFFYNDSH